MALVAHRRLSALFHSSVDFSAGSVLLVVWLCASPSVGLSPVIA